MNNFIRADGNPNIAMMTMFLGAGINIVLDPLFIYVFKMGMAGAALATILSQMISSTWVICYFLRKSSRSKLRLKYMKLKMSIVVKIVSLGLPGFLLQLSNSLLNIVLNKSLLIYGGDIAVSGMGVINSLQTLFLMPVVGIRQGSQPIISFNFGAKKNNRVKETVRIAIIAGTVIVTVCYIMVRLFPRQLIALFNQEIELLDFAESALLSWFLCAPVIGFQMIASNFFQAIDKPKTATFLTLTRQVIFLIPALLIFSKFWGLRGLLHAAPFADFFSAFITGIWFFFEIKDLKEGVKESSASGSNIP